MRAFSFVLLLVGSASLSLGQVTMRGRVVQETEGAGIPGVIIREYGSSAMTRSNEEGDFEIVLSSQDALISFRILGFDPLDEVRLADVPVVGGRYTVSMKERPIGMKETVVTAGRRAQSLMDVPVSVTTVKADALVGRSGLTLEEPLRFVSGVNIMDDQINIRGSSGYSRGVGSRVLLLFDGIPLLTGDTGEIIWEVIPLDLVERVEIVKGAGSALYGSSALGGVINIIPSTPPDGTRFHGALSQGVYQQPTFPEWRWSGRERMQTTAKAIVSVRRTDWHSVFSVSGMMDESHRLNDATHRYSFFNRSTFSVGQESHVSLSGHYVHRRGGNFFWWKSLSAPLEPPDDYRSRRVESDRGFLHAGYRTFLSPTSFVTARVQYYRNKWSDLDAGVLSTTSSSDRWNTEVQWTNEVSVDWNVIAGATAFIDRVESNIFGTHPGGGAAVFVQNDYSGIQNLTVSGGLRYDWQRVSVLPGNAHLDPRLGLTYRLGPATSLRASLGTGYRYPSIGEVYTSIQTGFGGVNVVPNPKLKAEKSLSMEVGAHHLLTDGIVLDGAVFETTYDALIEASVDPDELLIRFTNVERARVRGFEASLHGEDASGERTVDMGYTYVDPRNRDTGAILRFRPRHVLTSSIRWPLPWCSLRAEYRFVSRIEEVDENLVVVADIEDGLSREDIHVVNLTASKDLSISGVPVGIDFEFRNLLNYQYVELLANMAPPRMFVLSFDVTL